MKLRNILITGGSGFIGRNIHEKLGHKYAVFNPPHKKLDVTDSEAVARFVSRNDVSIIIHTALGGKEPVAEEIVRMFESLLRISPLVEKILHMGSGAEYGKQHDLIKVKESEFGKVVPLDSYGFGKYLCTKLARGNKKIITFRLFGVYGKYENYLKKFISNAIVKNCLGLPIQIKQDVIFDYLFIDDLSEIVDFFLTHEGSHREYNVTPTESISLTQIVSIINSISNAPSKMSVLNKGFNFQYTADNQRLRKDMPRLSFTSYHEGIAQLYAHYQKKLPNIDKEAIYKDTYLEDAKIKA